VFRPKYSSQFWSNRAKLTKEGHRLTEAIRSDLNRRYPNQLSWADLLQHLLGDCRNDLLLSFVHLEASAESMVRYLVIDLDDKAAPITSRPSPPSKQIRILLDVLGQIPVLAPERSIVFTSPSGRGRHLYYFLRFPQRAGILAARVAGYLHRERSNFARHLWGFDQDSGFDHIDLFPAIKSFSTMTPLPLCRGSYLCDSDGIPVEPFDRKNLLLEVAERLAPGRHQRLELKEFDANQDKPIVWIDNDEQHAKWHKLGANKPVRPASPTDIVSIPPPESDRKLNLPLTGPGQRRQRCREMLVHLRNRGIAQHEAIQKTREWLIANNNGQSQNYNASPKQALADVAVLARGLFQFAPEKYKITIRDVVAVAQAIRSVVDEGRIVLTKLVERRNLLLWTLHLVGTMKHFRATVEAFGISHSERRGGFGHGALALREGWRVPKAM
jgi:hypothetical protein